jgi:predicted RecB family nuclease
MHVYHYNHTERSALERLARQHGVGEVLLDDLVGTGAFVDLLAVIRDGMQVGVESYGLKHLEALAGYQRGDDIEQGAGAVVAYEEFMADGDPALARPDRRLQRRRCAGDPGVRDWLVEQRRRRPRLARRRAGSGGAARRARGPGGGAEGVRPRHR